MTRRTSRKRASSRRNSRRRTSLRYNARAKKPSDKMRDQERPEVFGHELDRENLVPVRPALNLAPGDYGCDPLGGGMFRMVPSGDIVDATEKERRLKARGLRRNSDAVEYRGFEIEKVTRAIQMGHDEARIAGTKRPKTRALPVQYLIHYPDGGGKSVNTMKAAREYIDNYLGDS